MILIFQKVSSHRFCSIPHMFCIANLWSMRTKPHPFFIEKGLFARSYKPAMSYSGENELLNLFVKKKL